MPKDYANIYNLSEEDREYEIKNLWENSIPGTKKLADNLIRKIQKDEYPYVLSVEASYGMGKTYFFSRFCEYAKNNGLDCVYMSAWENDYQPTPFCFITKEILQYLNNMTKPTIQSKLSEFKEKTINVLKAIISASHVQLGAKCGSVSFGADVDIDKIYQNLVEPKDEIKEFKKELENILVSNKIRPLILIIDELDRCRPDYALKTLEIIKHFFDVENLYVIIPINKEAITRAVKSIYGDIDNPEHYLRKLITENYIIPTAEVKCYRKIVESKITQNTLKHLIKTGIIEENDNFNGFNTIINCISQYAHRAKLTYRELLKVCNEFLYISRELKNKIHVEYLIYMLCNKYKPVKLNSNHPFYRESSLRGNQRYEITTINNIWELTAELDHCLDYNRFEEDYRSIVKSWENRNKHFEKYEQLYSYINGILPYKDKILKCNMRLYNARDRFEKLFDTLETVKNKAMEYQQKYGSADNDDEVKTYYDKIIDNPLSVYTNE